MEDPSSEKTIEENKRQLELEIELQKQQLAQMSAPKQNSSNFIGINEVLADQLRDMTSERNTLLRQRELWAKKDRIVDAQLHFKVFKALVKERKAKIDQMQKAGVHIHLEDQLILNLDQMTDERNEAVSKLTELQKELAENELLIGLLEEEISELKKQLEAFTGHTITQEGNHTNPVSEINPQVVQEQAEDENQQEKRVSPTTRNLKPRTMQNKPYAPLSRTEL